MLSVVTPESVQPIASVMMTDVRGSPEDGAGNEHHRLTTPEGRGSGDKIVAAGMPSDDTAELGSLVSGEVATMPITTIEGRIVSKDGGPTSAPETDNLEDVPAIEEVREPQLEEPTQARESPVTFKRELSVLEVESSAENDERATAQIVQANGVTKQEKTGKEHEGGFCEEGKTGFVKAPNVKIDAPALPQSALLHTCSVFDPQTAGNMGAWEKLRGCPAPVPSAPREHCRKAVLPPSRPPLDHDELQRTKAQLMKVRNDLEIERNANVVMRKTVEAETQASISAAMSSMLTDLLQNYAAALTVKAKAQDKRRDLQYREQKITQLEDYLAIGQKQLKLHRERQGIQSMNEIEEANIRREIELKVRHHFSDIEDKIAMQAERLRHQETTQKIREQQYMALLRDALKNEIREELAQDDGAKLANAKAAQAAYARGLAEGKNVARGEMAETALHQEFLKGYAAYYRSQTVLYKMRNGQISSDSEELLFLHDPTHPGNPYNVGLSIGRMEADAERIAKSSCAVETSHRPTEAALQTVVVAGRTQTDLKAVPCGSCVQAHSIEGSPSHRYQIPESSNPARPLQQARQMQKQDPVRSSLPARSTFASQLRESSTSVPYGVFASKTKPQLATTLERTTASSTTSGAPRESMPGRLGEGVYAGRRRISYKDSDTEAVSPNLIDLY